MMSASPTRQAASVELGGTLECTGYSFWNILDIRFEISDVCVLVNPLDDKETLSMIDRIAHTTLV